MGLVFGKPITSSISDETLRQIQGKEERLTKYGIPVSEKREKKGILRRVFEVIRAGETAPAVMAYLKGKPMTTEYLETFKRPFESAKEKPQAIYSDILEELGWRPETTTGRFLRGATGLGLDILLDPKTYLTFGAWGATKLFVKGKGVVKLSRTGTKLLRKSVTQFGDEAGRKYMASHVIRTGNKFLAKRGLKFMRAEMVPRKHFTRAFRGVDSIIEKIPLGGRMYKSFKAWESAAFHPWKNIEKLPAGTGEEYRRLVQAFYKGTRAEQKWAINRVQTLAKVAEKESRVLGWDIATQLPEYIEKGGKLSGNNFVDNLVKVFGKEHRRMIKTERIAGLQVGEIPDYLRHWITKEGRDYLSKIQDTRPVVRAITNISRRSPGFARKRGILSSIADINKELAPDMLRAGVKGNFFEPNAFKLLAIRKAEGIKAIKTLNFYDEVAERFTLQATDLEPGRLAEVLGEKVIWQDGMKYVDAGISIPALKGKFIPEAIRDHLKNVHAVISGADEPTRGFLKLYDKVLSWWKLSVTGWFPAFHSRNFIGGTWNNWLLGLKNPKWYFATKKLFTKPDDTITLFGKAWKNSDLLRKIDEVGAVGQMGMSDVTRTINDMLADVAETGKVSPRKLWKNPPTKALEFVENRLRIPLMLYRLDKGDSFEEAAKAVFRVHFDYAPEGLSAFERNVARRLIPFYTWTRHNVPLQFEMLLRQPGKYAGLDKLRRSIESVSGSQKVYEERKYLPEWMREMFTIRLPWLKSTGEPYYLQLDLPVEDLNKLSVREITSLLSPFLKYPIERVANKYIYFDSEIYNKDVAREYQTSRTMDILKHLPSPIKKFLNIQEMKRKNFYTGEMEPIVVIDARKLHFIRSLWFSRIYSSMLGATAQDRTLEERITRLLLGEPLRPLDIKEAEWRHLKERDIYLRDTLYYLQRGGIIPYKSEETKKKAGLVF